MTAPRSPLTSTIPSHALPAVESYPIKKLLDLIVGGRFAVPKLQREFVWDGAKAAKLFDSLVRGLPIGVVTIWSTSSKNEGLLPHETHVLPAHAEHLKDLWLVLDGQQRLSVLHNVASGGTRTNASGKVVDFNRVCLSLVADEGDLVQYRKPSTGTWYPLSRVLASNWKRLSEGLGARARRRVEQARQRILSTRVPVTVVATDQLSHAKELFIRINSLGTPLSAADRAFVGASRLNLRADIRALRNGLPERFRKISNEMILQTLALLEPGIKDVGARAMQQAVASLEKRATSEAGRKSVARHWRQLRGAFLKALEDLQTSYGVTSAEVLPSQYMVAVLSVYYYHARRRPTGVRRTKVNAWFWATGVCQRYTGAGFRPNVLGDADFMRRLALGQSATFQAGELTDSSDLLRASYRRRSALTDAIHCLLILQRPRDLLTGDPVSLDGEISPASAKHRHHVFPQKLLRQHKVKPTRINSICNIALVEAGTNSAIGAQHPCEYLRSLDPRSRKAVMKSHLLPTDKGPLTGGWTRDDYPRFLLDRQGLLVKALEQRAGRRLFSR